MLVAMEGQAIVDEFSTVFNEDWGVGNEWKPKSGVSHVPEWVV